LNRIGFSTMIVLLAAAAAPATNWPIPPVNLPHPLGNNWGNYQNYGGEPYFHPGIDVITPDTAGAEVRAVAHGWVKGWGTISADLHYRLAICDTSPDFTGRAPGWLYAHIDPDRWHLNEGDEIAEGDLIGYLVDWPIDATFDHLHFARISDTGAYWHRFPNYTWWFIQNPLTIISPNTDLAAPVIEDARPGQRFAFCNDNSSTYRNPDSLTGAVDIVAKVYDKTGYSTGDSIWDELAPFEVEHMIRRADGVVMRPWTLSLSFAGRLDDACINVLYKTDATCRSRGDYDRREYYYIVTNTDGDSIMETSDAAGNWRTDSVGDGDYWVIVRAWDVAGNFTTDSMLVTTLNGVAVEDLPPLALSAPLRAFPNPGSGPARISFGLGKPAPVQLQIFYAAGRLAANLLQGRLAPGEHSYTHPGLSAGVYYVRLSIEDTYYAGKLVMTR